MPTPLPSPWPARGALPVLLAAIVAAGCASQETGGGISAAHGDLVVCADGPTIDGIDVSKYQGTIDWDAVAADGVEFAFIRVSDGTAYPDGQYDRNWSEAKRVGVVRGTYQFFRPGGDPIAQANLLLDRMGPLQPGDLPPVVDVEDDDGQSPAVVADKLQQWLDHVQEQTGRTPIIYTGTWFWGSNVEDRGFGDYPLWIAQYGPECPDIPDAWSRWELFQTSSTGSVAGIDGNVDTNLFNGDLARLMSDFANGTPECGDGACNGDETHDSCPGDCPVCEPIPPAGRAVDESEALCFERGGNPGYWRSEDSGWESSLSWTHTTDAAEVDNYGIWHLRFEQAGRYRLEAHTPAPWAQARQALYRVQHGGVEDAVEVDQSAVDGWSTVGDFGFEAGGEQWVRLDDNTGEPYATRTRIAFDAVRLTRLDLDDGGMPPGDGGVPLGDGGLSRDDGGRGVGPDGDGGGGCGCRLARPAKDGGVVPLVLLVWALLMGRRRGRG